MRALLTGGCGFVGRHFVKKCFALGYEVDVVDDLSTGLHPTEWPDVVALTADEMSHLNFHHMDVRKFFNLLQMPSQYDLVFHCAAVVGGRKTIDGAPLYVATNLAIDAEFFHWVVTDPPRKVIYFSSSAVYPVELQGPVVNCALMESLVNFTANRIAFPDQTYGWSKLTGEYLMQLAVRDGLDCVAYRPFSGYGEDQDFSYPFPSVIRRVARRDEKIVLWGSGDQSRDFIHIDDVVEAVFTSCTKMSPGDVLNLGTGVGTSFKQLAKTAKKVLNHSAPIVVDADQPAGVFRRVADVYQMSKFYTPTIDLEEGIRRVADYQERNGLLTPGEK